MSYILIVKGGPEEAVAAALHRGFTKASVETCEIFKPESCIVRAEGDLMVAVKWFCERVETPFPPGTLLYYKEARS